MIYPYETVIHHEKMIFCARYGKIAVMAILKENNEGNENGMQSA